MNDSTQDKMQPNQGSSSSSSSSSTSSNQSGSSGSTGSTTELAKHAKMALSHVADQAKEKVGHELESQQKKSAGDFGNVAKALRSTREELGDNPAGPLLDRAADQVQRASDFVQNATLSEVLDEVEGFARREPLLFLGGAFAVGVLGARFLKSTARRSANDASSSNGSPRAASSSEGSSSSPTRASGTSSGLTGSQLQERTP